MEQVESSNLEGYPRPKTDSTGLRSNKAAFARLCTNLLERFQREVRRGTKVRDHQFPKPKSVLKLIYLESERYDPKSGGAAITGVC